jgi:cytidylate kinase
MNITISGLTAAGKTTHARLLASTLGYSYVSGSAVLAAAAGLSVDSDRDWWIPHGAALSGLRACDDLDREVDRRLVAWSHRESHVVFDAWALPWLSKAPMLRIWLQSEDGSRDRKCVVSHMGSRPVTLEDARAIIVEKDAESREIFRRLYGFDLFIEHDCFDVVLDLSRLIPKPTRECSATSVRRADAALSAIVLAALRHPSADPARMADAIGDLPRGAVRRVPADVQLPM